MADKNMNLSFECRMHGCQCDRLSAEVEALKPLLAEAADELTDSYNIMYPTREQYPNEMRCYKRDMDLVNRIHAALCGEGEK